MTRGHLRELLRTPNKMTNVIASEAKQSRRLLRRLDKIETPRNDLKLIML